MPAHAVLRAAPAFLAAAFVALPASAQTLSPERREECYMVYQKAILLRDGYDLTLDVENPQDYAPRLEAAGAPIDAERRVRLTEMADAALTADILGAMESVRSGDGAGPVLQATAQTVRACDADLGL